MRQHKSNIKPKSIFFTLLRGATWYYNAIYILFTYSASFIGFADDFLQVICNLHVQGATFGGKKDKFGRNMCSLMCKENVSY